MSAEERTFYRLAERLADYDDWIDCEQLMPVNTNLAKNLRAAARLISRACMTNGCLTLVLKALLRAGEKRVRG
jgi:hypothetical protein